MSNRVPVGLAIFARMDSSRLPGKALLDIGGRPMLGRVLDSCRAATSIDQIIVATSARAIDDPIAEFAQAEGADVFRGAVDDVLGRAKALADTHGLGTLVRISGDSPFMRADVIDQIVAAHLASDAELTTNLAPRTFPPGLSVEALSAALLTRLDADATDTHDREHVTRHIYANLKFYRIRNVVSKDDTWAESSLTVDTADDLIFARRVAARLDAAPDFSLAELVALADDLRQPVRVMAGATQ